MRSPKRCIAALILTSSLCTSASAVSKPPITLTISGPQTIAAGEKVVIQSALKNELKLELEVVWGEVYIIQIHDKNGKELRHKPGLWGAGGSSSITGIKPGETFRELVSLDGYDLSVPGKYAVLVKRPLHIVGNSQRATESSILESNEITITVLPRKQDGLQ